MIVKTNISILIKRANLKFNKDANRVLGDYGMTSSQFKIMKCLFYHPDFTITQRDLEKYFSMTNPTITGILQNLEKSGYIERRANPDDARSKVIGLTAQSRLLSENFKIIGEELDQNFTKNLSSSEKKELFKLLAKLIKED